MAQPFQLAELPAIEGEVATDDASVAHAAQDWGHLVQARPLAVARPAHAADVASIVAYASQRAIPVAARGAGHSPFGQSQAEGGIVLDMTGLSRVHAGNGNEITMDAGACWRQVLAATLPRGLTPAVLTDYLDLTVGGTLAVGGIGGASHHHGTQTDIVTALEVVTGTGELVRCSPEVESELFDAVRAGLGQCGIVTRATIRLRPAKQRVRRWTLYYDELDAFLEDQRAVVRDGRFDHVQGQPVADSEPGRWRYLLEAATYFSLPDRPDEDELLGELSFDRETAESQDLTYHAFLDRMAEGEERLRAEGDWFRPHPWLNLFLPDDEVESVVADTLAETAGADLGDTGLILLYPVRRDRLATPLLRVPATDLVWLFAILRTGAAYDPSGAWRMIELNTALYERVKVLGGTLYPASTLPMTTKDWRDHFGDDWQTLEVAKHVYDPAGVLTPGQRVFTAR
ncbi:FAD/FMN-containing dehydrogenase [Saccharomonospora amisosensis]|uniref:FAD/FMN-containing dehydrogenase n=1 Tax=Saccharomonospora amisosensis TaxID=1128677 RepID=A0A7X5UU52_9PSEU|nr:FAD-binding protein [Saccharomonospora amisosensis]NIJ13754.1 FAD/FMN-containing dehydrogenase [Saccharomonospora amisosensis]